MARQTVLSLLAIVFCLHSTEAFEFLWGMNATYNSRCPDTGYVTVPMPEEECKLGKYIMCSGGQAVALNDCPYPRRFNKEKGWCDDPENVPTPSICPTSPITPLTCDGGFTYLPVDGSCKKYIWCLPSGIGTEMACPDLSYYVHEKQRCLFITEPYVRDIPAEFLEECLATDPYTPAPNVPTAAPPAPTVAPTAAPTVAPTTTTAAPTTTVAGSPSSDGST